MRAVAVGCALLAGCFLKPDRPGGASDGGRDGASGDAAPLACAHYSDWSGPQALPATINTTTSDEIEPALSPDGKYLLFERFNDTALWLSAINNMTFGTPMHVLADCSGGTWTPDGTAVYAWCNAALGSAAFSNGSFESVVNTVEFTAIDPQGRLTFSGDGKAVYYETGSGTTHLARATGSIGHTWARDRELTELETGAASIDQMTPWISSDEHELYFSTSNGNAQLRSATRDAGTGMFSAPAALSMTQVDGWRPTLSTDGTLLIYSGADGDLYFATRTCLTTSAR